MDHVLSHGQLSYNADQRHSVLGSFESSKLNCIYDEQHPVTILNNMQSSCMNTTPANKDVGIEFEVAYNDLSYGYWLVI